jgi:hypothetical protein
MAAMPGAQGRTPAPGETASAGGAVDRPRQPFDGGEDVVHVERFGYEANVGQIDVGEDRAHQERGTADAALAQLANEGDAVEVRHHHVGQDQVRPPALSRGEGGETVVGPFDPIALVFEKVGEKIADRSLIVGDEYDFCPFHTLVDSCTE